MRSGHPTRWATHEALFPIDVQVPLTAIAATLVSAGAGDNDGDATPDPGAEFLIWDWSTSVWESLGSHATPLASCDEPGGSACTITNSPAGTVVDYFESGRIWLMAAPLYPSSTPPATDVDSEISTDYIELQVNYTLP